MATFKVALPTGQPPPSVTGPARSSYVDAVRNDVTPISPSPFETGFREIGFGFNTSSRPINALWTGQLSALPLHMLSIELGADESWDLRRRVPDGFPIPRYVVFGPVILNSTISTALASGPVPVEAGAILGNLSGPVLELSFFDAKNFAIEPTWCLHLFDSLGAWDLPDPHNNPLQPTTALPPLVSLLSPGLVNDRLLTLQSSNGRVRHIRPPATLQSTLFPFISTDSITVGLTDRFAGTRWRIVVQDLNEPGLLPYISPYADADDITFTPQNDVQGPSSITEARRLRYRITPQLEFGLTAPPLVDIVQDEVDTLRQEYQDFGFTMLPRFRFGRVQMGWQRISEMPIYSAPRPLAREHIGVDPRALPKLADDLAFAFERALHPNGLAQDDPRSWLTSDLETLLSYHNPRTHRVFWDASHPAVYGFYLLVRPRVRRPSRANLVIAALRDAGLEVLEELRLLNASRAFSRLEVAVLDKDSNLLWTWRIGSSGSVTSHQGPSGTFAVPDEATALEKGVLVELYFAPTDVTAALLIPEPRAKTTVRPNQKQSLIIIGSAVPGSTHLIPIDDSAYTLKQYLAATYPDDLPPKVVALKSPIDVFRELGAVGDVAKNFRIVCTMSHSYMQGLLIYSPYGLDPVADAGWVQKYIHSPQAETQMRDLYGDSISFGGDDATQYATHQFRVVHLHQLPDDMKRRLRENMATAEGIYIVGCNSDPDANRLNLQTIAQEFADITGRATWGTGNTSRFKKHMPDGSWVDHTQELGAGPEGEFEVILVPDTPGATPIGSVNILDVYRQVMVKCEPVVR